MLCLCWNLPSQPLEHINSIHIFSAMPLPFSCNVGLLIILLLACAQENQIIHLGSGKPLSFSNISTFCSLFIRHTDSANCRISCFSACPYHRVCLNFPRVKNTSNNVKCTSGIISCSWCLQFNMWSHVVYQYCIWLIFFFFFLSSIRPGGPLQSHIFPASLHWMSDWSMSYWLITHNLFWDSSCIHSVPVFLPLPVIILGRVYQWFNFYLTYDVLISSEIQFCITHCS